MGYLSFGYNNNVYRLDLEKFMEFVSCTPSSEKNTTTSISEVWASEDGDLKRISKEVGENKESKNVNFNNVRYDFARILLNTLMTPPENNPMEEYKTIEDMNIGQKIAFNTFLECGIIVEITEYNE